MNECRSQNDVILAAPTAALSWSDLRVPGAIAKLVRELARVHRRCDKEPEDGSATFVVLLDLDQKLIALAEVIGSSHFATARRALRGAIRHDATSIIVGIPRSGHRSRPTNTDFAFSKALRDGSRALGVTLLDLVIVTEDEYYSFREFGMIQEGPRG